jgi:hypothetical protein
MKAHNDGWFSLELPEIIKVNQLVRNEIQIDAFFEWYNFLNSHEQYTLIYNLFEFAYQAGTDDEIWVEAIQLSKLSENFTVFEIQKLIRAGFRESTFPNWFKLHEYLQSLQEENRKDVFLLAIYIFGLAEGRVYANETPESCNHWWHRDLLNESIVKSILKDPKFYMTSMQDDLKK